MGGKVQELWRKGFVEKISFESGVEERRNIMDRDKGNDELTCVRSDKHDKQADEVPWEADSRDRVMRDGKSGC